MKFEDLNAWQKVRELINAVYDMVRDSRLAKDFGLRDQIQRAAVSVMNSVAKASAGEVRSMSYLIADQKLASAETIDKVYNFSSECSALIQGLPLSTINDWNL